MSDDIFNTDDLPDPEKIELDFALEGIVKLYKGFRAHGLDMEEAIKLTMELMRSGQNGENFGE